jgi:hypothetical protein
MATTYDVALTDTWAAIANDGVDFTASFSGAWRYAVSASTPTVKGHLVASQGGGYGLTREVARSGKVYAKAEPPNATVEGAVTR